MRVPIGTTIRDLEGLRAWASRFRVDGLAFRVAGCRVWGLSLGSRLKGTQDLNVGCFLGAFVS